MVSNKSSNQIKCLELLAPVIVIWQVFNHFFNRSINIFQWSQFVFCCVVSCFVVKLVRLFFCSGCGFLYRERLLWNNASRWLFSRFLILLFSLTGHGVFGRICRLLFGRFINVLLWLDNKAIFSLYGVLLTLRKFLSDWIGFERSLFLFNVGLLLRHKTIALFNAVVLLQKLEVAGFLALEGVKCVCCFIFQSWSRLFLIEWLKFFSRFLIRKIFDCVNHVGRFVDFSITKLYFS